MSCHAMSCHGFRGKAKIKFKFQGMLSRGLASRASRGRADNALPHGPEVLQTLSTPIFFAPSALQEIDLPLPGMTYYKTIVPVAIAAFQEKRNASATKSWQNPVELGPQFHRLQFHHL